MTVRNLDKMFKPSSVALIGAGITPKTVGSVLSANLRSGGFSGPIFFVNPRHRCIDSIPCYPGIGSLPAAPDLAIIATPPHTVPEILGGLAERGTKAAIVITAGSNGTRQPHDTADWKKEMLAKAGPHLLRIVGPNCLGIMVPGHGLNGSFGHVPPLPGNLAFVAQSGAVLTTVLDWATSRDIGFSHFVSLGDMLDVDFGDMLNYLATDPSTRAILLYIESIRDTRKFMSAARAAARLKPVIVVKAGRFGESAKAAASHTGALAGVDGVYDAAFRRAGVLRVMDMEALFNAVQTLALSRPLSGHRLAILTNGGGVGVLATDTLIEKHGTLAELSAGTIARLNEVLPTTWSGTNPIDIIGDADESRYSEALSILFEDRDVDAILVMNCPTAITSCTACAQSVITVASQQARSWRRPMLLACWMGDGCAFEARKMFQKSSIPCYATPSDAIRGFMQMVRYQHSQKMLMETVPDIPCDFSARTNEVREIVAHALAESRQWLTGSEAMQVLHAYEIPTVPTYLAATPQSAAEYAASMEGPVALKIVSPAIPHKSDVGGVRLNLTSPEMVKTAAEEMEARIIDLFPDVAISGFMVQPMISRSHSRELIIGMFNDSQFGPILLFGHGGTAVEVIRDKALALPPLNLPLAHEVMSRTRVYDLLRAYRNIPAADLDAIAMTLVKISQLVCDVGEIIELDVNPLLADENGVLALDARIRIAPATGNPADRLAIRPYPKELEETLTLADGQQLLLRPIRPEDETGLQELFSALSPEEIRMRFLHPMKSLSHELAARLTQIDYDREMALVLERDGDGEKRMLLGGVRIIADPDNVEAEFAIMLRREATGTGLGPMMLRRIIDYSRKRGITRLYGDVLRENRPMLKLAEAFGFTVKLDPEDSTIRLVELIL